MKRSKKPKPEVEIVSYGKYSNWDRESRDLPELIDLAEEVKAEIGIEFGMIIEIFKAKGRYLDFTIDHPPFKDKHGNIEPSFEGTYQIRNNPYSFFLGDTIWEPVEDKKGPWTMTVYMDGIELASKTIELT